MQLSLQKCLLIGDTKQLPATVLSKEAEERNFSRSLLQRLLEDCKQEYTLLDIQYRMHPHISHWPSQFYYDNKIQDAETVKSEYRILPALKEAPSFFAPYAFINVDGEEFSQGHSFYNKQEAELLEDILMF